MNATLERAALRARLDQAKQRTREHYATLERLEREQEEDKRELDEIAALAALLRDG